MDILDQLSSPLVERARQEAAGANGVPNSERDPSLNRESLESGEVESGGFHFQHVSSGGCHESRLVARERDEPSELGDVVLEGLLRSPWGFDTPDELDQLTGGYRDVGVQEERSQDGTLAFARKRHGLTIVLGEHGPEYAKPDPLHQPSVDAWSASAYLPVPSLGDGDVRTARGEVVACPSEAWELAFVEESVRSELDRRRRWRSIWSAFEEPPIDDEGHPWDPDPSTYVRQARAQESAAREARLQAAWGGDR